jgi:type II secretory pathway component PulJ
MNAGAKLSSRETATPESDSDHRIRELEAEVAALRRDIAEAVAAQDRLHAQLSSAVDKLSELLRQRNLAGAVAPQTRPNAELDKNQAIHISRLETRMRLVENRLERVTGQVTSILESRIWKTLVKGGGALLRLVR